VRLNEGDKSSEDQHGRCRKDGLVSGFRHRVRHHVNVQGDETREEQARDQYVRVERSTR
jgi:hypothetical protein